MPRDGDLLGLSLRQPPSNLMAEQALLGAILGNNRAYERVAAFLRPEHFADEVHARIYEAAAKRIEAGQLADAVTLRGVFEHTGVLDAAGGVGYLAKLLGAMITINVTDYGQTIRDAWIRRELIEVGEGIVNGAFIPPDGEGPQAIVGSAMARLLDLGDANASANLSALDEAVATALADSQAAATYPHRRGLMTGIASLDRMWRGLWPGSLDILGARAETGKTALGMQIATAVAHQLMDDGAGEHVLVFSLEMSRADLGLRQLAGETGVPADDIRSGTLTAEQASTLVLAQKRLHGLPILIDDRAGLALPQIVLQARAVMRRKKLRLVVIDHLHRIRPTGNAQRLDHVADCTLRLKDLARSLNIPVLLLAQLSRASARREDHRPTKADLFYAGEADADNILLLYRPELYLSKSPPPRGTESEEQHMRAVNAWHDERDAVKGVAEAIFDKRRAGPIGMVKLRFNGPRTRFEDWDSAEERY